MICPFCNGKVEKGIQKWQTSVPHWNWATYYTKINSNSTSERLCQQQAPRPSEVWEVEKEMNKVYFVIFQQFFNYEKFRKHFVLQVLRHKLLFFWASSISQSNAFGRYIFLFSEYCFCVSARITMKSAYMGYLLYYIVTWIEMLENSKTWWWQILTIKELAGDRMFQDCREQKK